MFSGTTASVVFFDKSTIVTANSGDSRAILISQHEPNMNDPAVLAHNKSPGYYFTQLTRDHKPELPDEAARILKKNGRIEPSRISSDLLYP